MDRRIKYTKKVIKDCFLELLNTKDINKITVSELCLKADINRATFYRYYLDIYDLLEKIQNDFITELRDLSSEKDYTVYSFTEEMLHSFLKNKELLSVIFKTTNNLSFLNVFLETLYDKCKKSWFEQYGEIPNEEMELATTFIFNGALGVINYWIQDDFKDEVEHITRVIEELSYNGIRSYLFNEKKDN